MLRGSQLPNHGLVATTHLNSAMRSPAFSRGSYSVTLHPADCEEGGETAFLNSQWADPAEGQSRGPWSECAQGHVAAKPRRVRPFPMDHAVLAVCALLRGVLPWCCAFHCCLILQC